MHEEFEKLLKVLEKAEEQVNPNVNELLLKTLSFFNALKTQFKQANDEEKKEIVALMKDMHAKLSDEVKHMIRKTGLNEKDFTGLIQDPEQFTPEQQQILSKTKEEVEETKQTLLRSKKAQPEKKDSSHKKKHKKQKKDRWMKS